MVLISIDQTDKEEIDALSRELAEKLNVKGVSYAVIVHELVRVYKETRSRRQAEDELQEQENGYNQSRGL